MNPYHINSKEYLIIENFLELINNLETYIEDCPLLDDKIDCKVLLDLVKTHKTIHKEIIVEK